MGILEQVVLQARVWRPEEERQLAKVAEATERERLALKPAFANKPAPTPHTEEIGYGHGV